jgi:hypothetical protein
MQQKVGFAVSCVVVALATACADQPTAPARISGAPRLQAAGGEVAGIDRSTLRLPDGVRPTDQHVADAARQAINPADYVCSSNTAINAWFTAAVTPLIRTERPIFDMLYTNLAGDLVVTYDALVFQSSATPQYFGYTGRFTKPMLKVDRDVKRFWDIPSDDIELVGMHGSMLTDTARVARTYREVFGIAPATASLFAGLAANAVQRSRTLNGGDHPLFTFNAFAISTPVLGIGDKIVMGDGILEGYAALGFADVAPQAIYAHEFGHQIQFENGYFDDAIATAGTAAEQTRYTELMADAMAAYFLTHSRGAALNEKRVAQFLDVFYQIGDCGFTSPNHHGTPNQRRAAARFGFALADQAQKQGHILPSATFYARFVAAYPSLVAPDAR